MAGIKILKRDERGEGGGERRWVGVGGFSFDIIIEIEWVASTTWKTGVRVETEEAGRDVNIIDFPT